VAGDARGAGERHKSGILEKGVTLKAFGVDPEKSQLLETRKFTPIDVRTGSHLPPHKLGETTRTAFASLEQENQSFLDDSIEPWLVQFEEQSWDKLLTEEQKRRTPTRSSSCGWR
jgi:phage portal protein BeeE